MIKNMMEYCRTVSDDIWGEYALRRDLFFNRIKDDKKSLIKQAQGCGVKKAEGLKKQYSGKMIEQIADSLNIKIIEEEPIAIKGYHIFAQFREPDEIIIYPSIMTKAEKLIEDKGLDYLHIPLVEHFIAHEIFHVLEMNDNYLFTKTYKVSLQKIGPWKRSASLNSLSEIAAASFIKSFLQLDYSPFVLDVLMLFSDDKVTSTKIYNEVLSLTQG